MFGDLAKALAGQGPLNWDAARQFAQLGATGGAAEANVDPAVRLAIADLARIAWFHVTDVVGTDEAPPDPQVATRGQWASGTLDAYRHLFTEMATALGTPLDEPGLGDDDPMAGDPMMSMMAGLSKMMAPAMLGMAVGSMVGRLATRVFGVHDLPIPRQPATVTLIPANIDEFVGGVGDPDRRDAAVGAGPRAGRARHPRRPAPAGHAERPRPPARRRVPPRPERRRRSARARSTAAAAIRWPCCSGRSATPRCCSAPSRRRPRPSCGRASTPWWPSSSATPTGSSTPSPCASSGGNALRIAEAVRRRRVETSATDTFVEQLLGIRLGEDQVARGKAFVQGVVDRAGDGGLAPLLQRPDAIPTPAEVDAPGLWLARLES